VAKQREYVGRETRPCEKCGKGVTRKHSAFRDHTFCSKECYLTSDYLVERRNASNARRFAGKRVVRPCRQCGADVERAISQFKANTFCSRTCEGAFARARATRLVNSHGYVWVFVGKDYPGAGRQGQILEHRKVMQDHLGRALTVEENVHHVNGDRQDNRLENLELWSRSQPPGQRVADKLAWAREFIALYEGAPI
jgi:endogenous inhibitor of DNA gyrase (YacG/DUF329 family)